MSTKTEKKTEKKVSKLTAEQNEARTLKFRQGNYYLNVIKVNSDLNIELKSLGGARAKLLNATSIDLPAKDVKLLKCTKDSNAYKILVANVRCSKTGNYSPFFILQALYNTKTRAIIVEELNKIGFTTIK